MKKFASDVQQYTYIFEQMWSDKDDKVISDKHLLHSVSENACCFNDNIHVYYFTSRLKYVKLELTCISWGLKCSCFLNHGQSSFT